MKFLRSSVLVVFGFALVFFLPGCMQGPAREGSFTREFSVSGPTVLDVQSPAGRVSVHPGADNKVSIQAHIRARGLFSGLSGEEKVRRIQSNPPVVQQGNTIRVGRMDDLELRKNVFMDYEITVPADSQATIITGAGNINVRGLKGSVRATTGAGTIVAEDLVDDVRLETGAGNIEARGLRGRLDANSGAGSIKTSGELKKDWRLNVGAGSIHLALPVDASFDLDAASGFGKINVSSDFELKTSTRTNSQVRGTVGKGGPLLRVNNGAGSIDIARGSGSN